MHIISMKPKKHGSILLFQPIVASLAVLAPSRRLFCLFSEGSGNRYASKPVLKPSSGRSVKPDKNAPVVVPLCFQVVWPRSQRLPALIATSKDILSHPMPIWILPRMKGHKSRSSHRNRTVRLCVSNPHLSQAIHIGCERWRSRSQRPQHGLREAYRWR